MGSADVKLTRRQESLLLSVSEGLVHRGPALHGGNVDKEYAPSRSGASQRVNSAIYRLQVLGLCEPPPGLLGRGPWTLTDEGRAVLARITHDVADDAADEHQYAAKRLAGCADEIARALELAAAQVRRRAEMFAYADASPLAAPATGTAEALASDVMHAVARLPLARLGALAAVVDTMHGRQVNP